MFPKNRGSPVAEFGKLHGSTKVANLLSPSNSLEVLGAKMFFLISTALKKRCLDSDPVTKNDLGSLWFPSAHEQR
jgi:hypothetical protein